MLETIVFTLLIPMVPSFMIIGGVYLIYIYFRELRKKRIAKTWQHVNGIVTDAQVIKPKEISKTPNYKLVINYSYEVEEKNYKDNKVNLGGFKKGSAYNEKNNFPPGTQVVVFYNPKRPEKAFLKMEIEKKEKTYLFAGIALLIVGIWFNIVLFMSSSLS